MKHADEAAVPGQWWRSEAASAIMLRHSNKVQQCHRKMNDSSCCQHLEKPRKSKRNCKPFATVQNGISDPTNPYIKKRYNTSKQFLE